MKGIKFNAEGVNGILAGRKVMTRRPCKVQPDHSCYYVINGAYDHALHFAEYTGKLPRDYAKDPLICVPVRGSKDYRLKCPFGKIGDKVFVKEDCVYIAGELYIAYRADGEVLEFDCQHQSVSAYHMPKRASRITLQITDIKVERLQDISEEDAIKEGIQSNDADFYEEINQIYFNSEPVTSCSLAVKNSFIDQWNSIYKKTPAKQWDANPFVWVISFEVV